MLPSVYLSALIGIQFASANRQQSHELPTKFDPVGPDKAQESTSLTSPTTDTQNIKKLLPTTDTQNINKLFNPFAQAKFPQARNPVLLSANATNAQSVKNVVFMRHGLSIGNWAAAHKLKAVWDFGGNLLQEVADGELHESGEKQVENRVKYMTREDITRIVATEVVLVSPLKRAMATALILLAKAYCKHDANALRKCKVPEKWPKVVVVPTLREKVGSMSDVPGDISGPEGSLAYIKRIANDYSRRTFGDANGGAMNGPLGELHESLIKEQKDESNPDTDMKLVNMIDQFKEYLSGLDESKILAVGHGTWSRTAFSAFMPNPTAADEDVLLANVINGQRSTMTLNNAGMLEAEFDPKEKIFTSIKVGEVQPGTIKFPNCQWSRSKRTPKLKTVTLTSLREAQLTSVVPEGSTFEHFAVKYEKATTGWWSRRMVTLSQSKAGVNFAWLGGSGGHDQFHMEIYKLSVREEDVDGEFYELPAAYAEVNKTFNVPRSKFNFNVIYNGNIVKFYDPHPFSSQRDISIKFVDEGNPGKALQDFKKFASSLTDLAKGHAKLFELTKTERVAIEARDRLHF